VATNQPISDCNASPTMTSVIWALRYVFSSFVSCFYKLTNRNFSFLGSILPVTTGTDVARPTLTPRLHYPLLPIQMGCEGYWLASGHQGGAPGDP